jgi:hypothetical protein
MPTAELPQPATGRLDGKLREQQLQDVSELESKVCALQRREHCALC